MKRTNLTRIPLLLGAVITTAIAPTFGYVWRECVYGNATRFKVWNCLPSFGYIAEYLDISYAEANLLCGWPPAEVGTKYYFTRWNKIKDILKLVVKYLRGKGDEQ